MECGPYDLSGHRGRPERVNSDISDSDDRNQAGRYLVAARRRGAHVVTIDVRRTEAAAQSDEVLILRPGTDAALALGMMHVLIGEGLLRRDVRRAPHRRLRRPRRPRGGAHTPEWAAAVTGVDAPAHRGARAPLREQRRPP